MTIIIIKKWMSWRWNIKKLLIIHQLSKKVFTFNTNPELYLYEERDGNDVVCWAVPPNNKFVYAYVAHEIKPDGGVITTSVFNDRKFPTVAYRIYQDYLLGKYKYIMSDGQHTNRGESFWRKHVYTSVNDYTKKSIYLGQFPQSKSYWSNKSQTSWRILFCLW